MSDESKAERLHLEGLDEATERERREGPYYSDDMVTLYQGDAVAVLASLQTASVDALITDPPYSSGGQYKGDKARGTGAKYGGSTMLDFSGDNRDQRSFLLWMNLWLGEAIRVVKPGGICALFTDWRQLPTMTDALQIGGWVWRGVVPWVKPTARPAFKQRAWLNQCEYVVWGTAGSSAVTEDGATQPFPGFYAAAPPRDREHQPQKPLDVMRKLATIAPVGGVILDPFAGSGTTGAAALIEGRSFIGVEMNQHYAEVAAARLQAVTRGHRSQPNQDVLDFGEPCA